LEEVASSAALLSLREVAERVGVSENTVRHWMFQGLLHPIHDQNGLLRFPDGAIDRFADERRRLPRGRWLPRRAEPRGGASSLSAAGRGRLMFRGPPARN
jgi:predicted DNA-binding transcriptional regulator AlpA